MSCRVIIISKSTFTKSQKSGHISFCLNSQITLLCWMDETFYYLYLWWEISCIFYNTRLNTHMMEKCQIILTPINTIRHITINCEQFSWNVNCCLRQRKTSYDMICGHVNTKECYEKKKTQHRCFIRWGSTNQQRINICTIWFLFKFCKYVWICETRYNVF